ncbi:MAG: nuclear transport factor 2 family protein [Bacteroidia bacterium]|nr:nuclear transport factor 2 family protein [Bacteroidia bacterium]
MKKRELKTLLLVVLSLCLGCQQPKEKEDETEVEILEANHDSLEVDSAQIVTNFKRQEDCWNRHDIPCYMEAYDSTSDIQTLSRGGLTIGYDSIISAYQKNFPEDRMGNLFFDEMDIRILSKEYAYVTGRFNLKFEQREQLYKGWFSVLMRKRNDGWFIISDHSS